MEPHDESTEQQILPLTSMDNLISELKSVKRVYEQRILQTHDRNNPGVWSLKCGPIVHEPDLHGEDAKSAIPCIQAYNTNWFYGTSADMKPLHRCIEHAAESNHQLLIAMDVYLPRCDVLTKYFGSYASYKQFWNATKNVPYQDRCFYIITPGHTKCCLYGDLEWPYEWKTVDEIKVKFKEIVMTVLETINISIRSKDFLFANASNQDTNKGSLHVHVPSVCFKNIVDQKKFFNRVKKQLTSNWDFIDETDKSYIQKTFIDFNVYNKNRQFRLPYSSKRSKKHKGHGVRPLLPEDENSFDISEWIITHTAFSRHTAQVDSFSDTITCTKRNRWSKKLVQNIIDDSKLEVTIDTFVKGKFIGLRNKTKERKCRLSGAVHKSNNSYLLIKDNKLHYCCHSDKCKHRSKIIYEFESDPNSLYRYIPFKQWRIMYQQHRKRFETKQKDPDTRDLAIQDRCKFIKEFVVDINKYCVAIEGTSKPYVLYRELEDHTIRDVKLPTVKYNAKTFDNFTKTFLNFSTKYIGPDKWINSPMRNSRSREDCIPYENIRDVPENVFNTYQGLSINKERALLHGDKKIEPVLEFIKNHWCKHDIDKGCDPDNINVDLYHHVLDWMAHLIQKPWKKMSFALVLMGREGTGKGMIVQLLGEIIGPVHYYQPTSNEEMFGKFNNLLDNRILCFADEMVWGGDKKHSGLLKKLLTETRRTSNTKYGPTRETTNYINWVMASNEDWVVPAGSGARRYTVIEVDDWLKDQSHEVKKRLAESCPFSFAKFLYNRDISNFDPNRCMETSALSRQKERNMKSTHRWLYNKMVSCMLNFNNDMRLDYIYGQYKENTSKSKYQADLRQFQRDLRQIVKYKERKGKGKEMGIKYINLGGFPNLQQGFAKMYGKYMKA